jgi:hypothetical protein
MNNYEKDIILNMYYQNDFESLSKIIRDKKTNLSEVNNSFGETLFSEFIADGNYDLLVLSLEHHKNNINNVNTLLKELLDSLRNNQFLKQKDSNKIKAYIDSVNILIFHPLVTHNYKIIKQFVNISKITNKYPSILNQFLNKNNLKKEVVASFLNVLQNTKMDNVNKINFQLQIKNVLENYYLNLLSSEEVSKKNKFKV